MSRKWCSYADSVRGYASDKDAWLRTYQIQDEEDAIEIASALSVQMEAGSELTTKKQELQKLLPGRFPVIMVEKFRNWGMTQQMNVLSVRPKSVKEVEQVIDAMKRYNDTIKGESEPPLSIRCVGDGHSWSPLFPDDGNVLMYTSELVLESGERIRLNEPSRKDRDITVTIVPGVTTGDLSEFFKKNNVCLKSDVILDKVTYGGVIATGCHGVGKDQKSVSDYVTEMSIVGVDAKEERHNFAAIKDPNRVNSLKCNLGLFGIMTNITMVVEPMVIVRTENDFSLTVEDVFYDPGRLKELHDNNWSVEIFWFPFNSLSWSSLMRIWATSKMKRGFGKLLIPKWNPKEDKLWIRKINIAEVPQEPCPTEVDYAGQDVKGLASTGFGRIVSNHLIKHPALIPSFLKTGFNMVQNFNAATRFEPINKAIHYQSFIEIMPVVDMEFAFNASSNTFPKQSWAMQEVVEECERLYKQFKFPLSVAMEMRWIAGSDCLVCPARAVQNKKPEQTLYLEILGLAGQPDWETFTQDIAKKWMEMELNGRAPVPHWAKQWGYLNGIDQHIQKAYGQNLKKFRRQVTKEEKALFSNKTLNKAIFRDATKQTVPKQKPRSTKASDMPPLTMKEVAEAQPSSFSAKRLSRAAPREENATYRVDDDEATILEEVDDESEVESYESYESEVESYESYESEDDAEVLEEVENTLMKHEKSWEFFFNTLGQQVWNVPNKVPMMNIQREWEFAQGLIDELADKTEKHSKFSVDKTLYHNMFM